MNKTERNIIGFCSQKKKVHKLKLLFSLYSALYYNNGGVPSFNSSGRSSNCDEGDMQSDISLEEDVNDLNHKVILFILNLLTLKSIIR